MKRAFCTVLAIASWVQLMAQNAPFTIVRPADGSKVRETVRIDVPKYSVPSGGYFGVFVNGKFIEATMPRNYDAKGRFYTYNLDTKKLQIPDGPTKIELALYVDFKDQPRIIDRSSVQVTVANHSSISIPPSGLQLRYRFNKGTAAVYDIVEHVEVSDVPVGAKAGAHGSILEQYDEKLRVMYAVDNVFPGGDGLIRQQAVSPRGRDFFYAVLEGQSFPRRFTDDDIAPSYARLREDGREVFGAIPIATPFDGVGGVSTTNLYLNIPLPTLPQNPVHPGSNWPSNFQVPNVDLNIATELKSLVKPVSARGEFVRLEWEQGHPCAVLRNSIAEGSTTAHQQMSEDIWFALDMRQIFRWKRTIEITETGAPAGAGNQGNAGNNRGGNRGTGNGGGRGNRGFKRPGTGDDGGGDTVLQDDADDEGPGRVRRNPRGNSSGSGTRPPTGGQNRGEQRTGAAIPAGQARKVTLTLEMTLER
ncbi:MAG: hypothetical protein JSS72_02730 [Armatimonadetes bacterium]|nr:hypothetical protein [Armatimonadota bacterium]